MPRSMIVELGDVIVVGSDGLFDNVSHDDINALVSDYMKLAETKKEKWSLSARYMARNITQHAYEVSLNKKVNTPYSMAASEAFNMVYSGGKKDDITVLVGIVDSQGK
mmetsp:Transcript_42889/g.52046  ORF Transcript_42889/g.52046 Transcript_42889/m.52046 type:complete len:108 (-) Transcript_42889:29-352(-)